MQEQIELLKKKNIALQSAVLQGKKINFYLDDFVPSLSKTYFFTFVSDGGYVVISHEKNASASFTLGNVVLIGGGKFYLKKGVYEVKAEINYLTPSSSFEVYVYGNVRYYDSSRVKTVNACSVSYIAHLCGKALKLYQYDGQVALIDSFADVDFFDVCYGDRLYLSYLSDGTLYLKSYLADNSGVVTVCDEFVDSALCDYDQKIRLYVVKGGILSVLEENGNAFTRINTSVKAKKLFAVKGEKVVYEDYGGRIRVCFSCFPT